METDRRLRSTATTDEHVAMVAQLIGLLEVRLLDPLDRVTADLPVSRATVEALRVQLHLDAEVWAAQLLGRDAERSLAALHRVLGTLGDDDPAPSWWGTPLGRLVLRTLGHPRAHSVSLAEAGAMLGITRQGAHDLVRRGKLARADDGRVSVDSIRNRLLST